MSLLLAASELLSLLLLLVLGSILLNGTGEELVVCTSSGSGMVVGVIDEVVDVAGFTDGACVGGSVSNFNDVYILT